jgi:Transposase
MGVRRQERRGGRAVLADMVRTGSHQLRPAAGDSAEAEAESIKVVTRTHKTMIWERTRHIQRLRHALRDYFPAALVAFEDLAARGHAGVTDQGPCPGLGSAGDDHPDQCRAEASSPTQRAGQD